MVKKSDDIILKLREILGERNDDDVLSLYEDIKDSIDAEDPESYETRAKAINDEWESKYRELDDYWRSKYAARFFTTPDEVVEKHEEDSKDEEEITTFDELFKERED